MTEIDPETVRKVARLARLRLRPEEERSYARDMGQILSHFDELRDLDLEADDDGPAGRGLQPRLRPDAPGSDALVSGPEDSAPDWRDGLFVVPRLPALGEDGGQEG